MKRKTWMLAGILTTAAIALTGSLRASSHREAPLTSQDPLADNTDAPVRGRLQGDGVRYVSRGFEPIALGRSPHAAGRSRRLDRWPTVEPLGRA